jgi:hypothetical protein
VLRRIFVPKGNGMVGGWRNLRSEELHKFFSSPNIIVMIYSRGMRWTGHVAYVREKRNACRILVRRPEYTRPLGMAKHRWEDNIKMNLIETAGWNGMD